MSACPSPATLKQVLRKESHVCTKSFRPDGSRGFVGSILTGKNYARSPQHGKDNQGTHPEGNAVLGVRLVHEGTVFLRSSVGRWQAWCLQVCGSTSAPELAGCLLARCDPDGLFVSAQLSSGIDRTKCRKVGECLPMRLRARDSDCRPGAHPSFGLVYPRGCLFIRIVNNRGRYHSRMTERPVTSTTWAFLVKLTASAQLPHGS